MAVSIVQDWRPSPDRRDAIPIDTSGAVKCWLCSSSRFDLLDEGTMLTGRVTMAKLEKVAATAVRRAKATSRQVQEKGKALATQLAQSATELIGKKGMKEAKKTVARARTQASKLASKAVAKITRRPKKKTKTKLAVAAAGAAAVAAAGLSVARRRKR
jgi:hypothetical protein